MVTGEFSSRPPDHHLALSGGPTEDLVDWGHRTTLISSPVYPIYRATQLKDPPDHVRIEARDNQMCCVVFSVNIKINLNFTQSVLT